MEKGKEKAEFTCALCPEQDCKFYGITGLKQTKNLRS
jgi:hypothetical protein